MLTRSNMSLFVWPVFFMACSLPELAALKARLQGEGRSQSPGLGAVFMTGSGSTIVGVGSDVPPAFLADPSYQVCCVVLCCVVLCCVVLCCVVRMGVGAGYHGCRRLLHVGVILQAGVSQHVARCRILFRLTGART